MVGSIILDLKIDDTELSHEFVVMDAHLRTLILGRDFLKKMNAKIDCKRETIKYNLMSNHDVRNYDLKKIKSTTDTVIPKLSIKLIRASIEAEDGEYVIEENNRMTQTNGLRLARSLLTVTDKKTHIWITNPYPRPLKIMKDQTLAYGSLPAGVNFIENKEKQNENDEIQFQINKNLSFKEQERLKQILAKYTDLFSSRLGRTSLAKHQIHTEDAKPIKHKPYRVSAKERTIIKDQIDEMLEEGIIRQSSSPWSFPVILVKKRDGKYRFCVDYRKLNEVTVKDVYPIPRIDDVMDTLQGSKYFSAIDLKSGYWQVEIEERDKEKTAFTTAHGLYEFNVMPFGLCNAPATFERNMDNVLGNLRWQICLCYLYDVIIYSSDFPTHIKRLEAVLRCFSESNLKLNAKKCRFAFEELEILGHITNQEGIKPAEYNIKAVRDFPQPKKAKEVQSFLGMCSYYRKFIKDFSLIADPLTSLIRKNVQFIWTGKQEEAFQNLKKALMNPPILGHFDPNAATCIHTDASNIGLGATLIQNIGGEEKNFKEENGCLYKKNPNPEGREWLLVVPKKRRKEIMSEYHNHMLNGHLGVARTTYRLKNKYYWPSMLKDVSEFVKTCHLCQSRKGSNQLPSGLLQPIPPANYPFERIGIDFVGPLPSTKRRRKWIIVLTDYYTKYAETKAVPEATVKEVSTFLIEHIFLRHGAPRFLISDRGSQFTSNLMKEVMKMCKVKHCFTTSYHPQTNGLTERLNRTLINMISMYVNTDQKNWDEILPFITHAYNTTIQETTGYSPFFLLFGREPMSLLDDENIPTDSDMDDYDEYIENYLDKIARTRQVVINNTEKTQERMKRNYDKKHNERIYEPGHLVAVWTPVRKIGKCEKLLRKYFGPYRILKKLSNVNYLIEPKDNPGQDPLIVHVSRLKPYFERIDEVTHEDRTSLAPSRPLSNWTKSSHRQPATALKPALLPPARKPALRLTPPSPPLPLQPKGSSLRLPTRPQRGPTSMVPQNLRPPESPSLRPPKWSSIGKNRRPTQWSSLMTHRLTQEQCLKLSALPTLYPKAFGPPCEPKGSLSSTPATPIPSQLLPPPNKLDGMKVRQQKVILPRICLFKVDEETSNSTIEETLLETPAVSQLPGDKVVRVAHRSAPRNGTCTAFIEVDLTTFRALGNRGRIVVDGVILNFEESIRARVCFRCCGFGHNSAQCTRAPTCFHCGEGGHEGRACPSVADWHTSKQNNIPVSGALVKEKAKEISVSLGVEKTADSFSLPETMLDEPEEWTKLLSATNPAETLTFLEYVALDEGLEICGSPELEEKKKEEETEDDEVKEEIMNTTRGELDHPFAAQAIRRSRRIQGLNPLEYSKMQQEGRETPQGEYHFKHIRNPSIFSGEPGQSSEKWLKEYHRVARYNCWDSSMCLANVYFFLSGTAKVWFENVEEKITSWELFETMLSQAFGHYSSEKDQLLEKLKARAQGKEESSEAYIQDVLYLCRQINPNMNENEKVAHLVKGVSEEIYRAIVTFEIANTEEFIRWCRKIELSQKKRVNTRIVFDRLPNAAAINPAESESMEDLIRRIVREEIHHALNPEPATLKPSSLDLIIREEVERNLSAISQPVQRPMPRQQYSNPQIFKQTPRQQFLNQSTPAPNQTPPQRRTDEWRTHENVPICFHCGRPGHVARYCRDRRRVFEEARMKRNAVALSPIQSISSPPKPGKLRRATETGGKAADESLNPPPIIIANMKRNYVVIIINGQNVEALVDSGADYSVISENFRRYLKIPFFAEKGPVLRVANRKHIETLGRCNLKVSIEELEIYFTFVVFSECSHHIILGLDFFRATSAVIDCGKGEIHLKESVNDGLEEDLPTHALEDCFIPARSIKKITVINEDIRGGKDLMIEGSKDLILKKELVIPSSIINFHHGRGEIWITNGTSQNQIIPAGMLVGNLRKIGSSGIYSVDTAEDDKTQSNIKSEDRRQQILSLVDERLDKEQKSMIVECLEKYSEVFDFERKSFSTTSNVKHKIDTSDSRPIKQRPYRVSPVERRSIQSEVDKMIKMGIVQPSESPWSSPVVLVKKKDGSWRFCVDYRKLNKVTKKDVYPLPRNDDVLDSLTGTKFFSSMDLRTGYWQIEIDEEDREKTAFITPDGLYEFRVMPFGLCNAPATFERMMDKLLAGLKWTICLCYLDDIIVYATSFKEHIERLGKVLRCIQQAGLCINHEKCRFGSREIKVLGHLVTESGIRPDPDKIEAITNFPTPKTAHEVRSFMGLCSYYRRFVKDFANKAKPLHDLLRNNVKFFWSNEQEQSFQILKSALTTDPVLGHFKEDAETLVHTDASGYGVGAVLTQLVEGKEKPIAYASRTLNAAERNYSTTERECLAVVWAIYKFRPYLFGKHFTVVSDHHSLCWLANVKDPSGRLARWALRLQEFDISIVYKNGKRHQDADCLSRSPLPQSNEDNIPELSSITDIGKEQRSDVQTKKIIQEIDYKSESGYKIIDGILYRKNYDPMGKPWLLVVPKQMRVDILSEAHDAPMAGHLGFAKTYDRIRRKYFWPGLHRSVRQYVAHCRECQRRKGSTERPPGQLVPIPPVARPFQKIGIDLLGRFPTSNDGNKWTVVATDYLTRYAMTKAIPNGSSEEVGKFLVEDVILKHGAPRELISDRGRTFISHTIREINNLCGTAHRFTSAYHPQTNGLTERLNKTLGDMLSMYVDVDQRNWDSVLPYVTFAYNTAKQETTGFSPFYLVHGRDVETPLDTIPTYREEANLEDYVESLVTNAEDARQLARLNILKAQEKDKSRYDKSHRPVQYRAEDLVWVYTPVRKQGLSEKLLKRYFGPYKVVRQLSE
ncbi:hypothetical protein LAZ67_9003705, partial [Cordylochernes scorpioides]